MPFDPPRVTIQAPFTIMDVDIVWDADFKDPLPQMWDADGAPVDFTGKELEWYIRPAYDFAGEFIILTSAAGTIVFDDAEHGLASANVPRATVQSTFATGPWKHFLLLKEGTAYTEIARGPFTVHKGLTTAMT